MSHVRAYRQFSNENVEGELRRNFRASFISPPPPHNVDLGHIFMFSAFFNARALNADEIFLKSHSNTVKITMNSTVSLLSGNEQPQLCLL
jgi:hypothetical protein